MPTYTLIKKMMTIITGSALAYSTNWYDFINAQKKEKKEIQSDLPISLNWWGKYGYLCVIYIESLEHVINWKVYPQKWLTPYNLVVAAISFEDKLMGG